MSTLSPLSSQPAAQSCAHPPARRMLLASQSPRRRELLSSAGVVFEVQEPGIDDAELRPGPTVNAEQFAASLALLKAQSAWRRHARHSAQPATLVVGADTIVVKDGRMIGKPLDAADAVRIIRLLQGGSHQVVTGVALLDTVTGSRDVFVDKARVALGPLTAAQIDDYVASGQWQGKAGGYNLFERQTAGWPITVQGDQTAVVGLPMQKLLPRLARYGLQPAGPTSPLSTPPAPVTPAA
ncbi:MAG: Maf family protein [Planctomycetaceae bacterium]|jgi:septum formation protein|nr:Maf family protein [Planctomycetaceae bacterium]